MLIRRLLTILIGNRRSINHRFHRLHRLRKWVWRWGEWRFGRRRGSPHATFPEENLNHRFRRLEEGRGKEFRDRDLLALGGLGTIIHLSKGVKNPPDET